MIFGINIKPLNLRKSFCCGLLVEILYKPKDLLEVIIFVKIHGMEVRGVIMIMKMMLLKNGLKAKMKMLMQYLYTIIEM